MTITLLERRVLEAQALGPVVEAFARDLGELRARELLTETHTSLAREAGLQAAAARGRASLGEVALMVKGWSEGGALETELLEQTAGRFFFNVTRCRYAEEYDRLGLRGWGNALSCCRDLGFIAGFNPRIRLTRTQTIMEGAPFCDFRYRLAD